MFHVEIYGEFFLRDGLQKYDVSETIFAAFFRRLYQTYDCIGGGTGNLWNVVFCSSFTLQLLSRMERV
jgi:hypothetical protein